MNQVTFEPVEHKYFDENGKDFPSVTTLLKHFGMSPDFAKWGNDASRNFGSAVHRALELFDNDVLDQFNYDAEIEPYLNAYKRFLDEFKPVWEFVEIPMLSKVWGFAGCADRVGVIKGKNVVLDFKTGSPDASHELQTAGYQVLVEENSALKIKERYSLYLKADDFRLSPPHVNRSDRSIMIGLSQAYQFKTKHKLIK